MIQKYPNLSSYASYGNNPILYVDLDGKKPTGYEAALMVKYTYDGSGKLTGQWTKSALKVNHVILNDPKTSLKSQLFERTINNKTEYAYVTAGTEDLKDWLHNGLQLRGLSMQYSLSGRNAHLLDQYLDKNELTMVGHSLGGAEAYFNGVITGRDAITFNPATVSPYTFEVNKSLINKAYKTGDFSHVTNYIVQGEVLNWLKPIGGGNGGETIFLYPKDLLSQLNNHFNVYDKFMLHSIDKVIEYFESGNAINSEAQPGGN